MREGGIEDVDLVDSAAEKASVEMVGAALAVDATAMSATLRDLAPEDGISVTFESCTDLESWSPRPDLVSPDPDQSGVPSSFTRMLFHFPPADLQHFVRIAVSMP